VRGGPAAAGDGDDDAEAPWGRAAPLGAGWRRRCGGQDGVGMDGGVGSRGDSGAEQKKRN
jgi:hypothetical protein